MQCGYVVSDLHLLAQRSVAAEHVEAMHAAAAAADFFVLNGDIFDFRWSALPTVAESVAAAAEWLRAFVARHRECRFIYVLGNHDGVQAWAERVAVLAGEIPNLECHASHVRINGALFLHGDLALDNHRLTSLARTIPPAEPIKSAGWKLAYRLLVATRAHRCLVAIRGKSRCARRLFRALNGNGKHALAGVTNIYFGHSHVPFSGYAHEGITFHNTGSAIRGLWFNMLRVQLSDAEDGQA